MLAFAAVISLDGAPVDGRRAARLRESLSRVPGAATEMTTAALSCVHVTHDTPLEYDRDVPLTLAAGTVLTGLLRLDDRERLRAALRPDDPAALGDASDARLALLAYERWGERFGEHLMGDFAICLWDASARQLVCARDHHGNRPLFWSASGGQIAVSSCIEGVQALETVSRELREDSLVSFLEQGFVQDPHATVWRDVHRLPRGTTMTVGADGAPRFREHWTFPVPAPLRYRDERDYTAHFTDVLSAAIRDRLRARDAAIFLSGGVDSGTLATVARTAAPSVTLHALTSRYPTLVPSDEERLAALVASHLGIGHEEVVLDDSLALDWLAAREAYPPQPVDEPDLGRWRAEMRLAAQRAPVAVFGEDGDTLMQAPTLLAQLRSQPFAEVVGSWFSYYRRYGRRPWVGLQWRDRLRRLVRGTTDRTPWLRPEARVVLRRSAARTPVRAPHPVRPHSVALLTSSLWEAVYEGMSPSITGAPCLVTLPLVDPRVIEFVFAIPPVPWGQNKQLLRDAMRGRLPEEVRIRPKTPFSGSMEARVAQWRAAGGANAALSKRVAPWVDRSRVEAVYRGGDTFEVVDAWRVLQLDRWLSRMTIADA